MMLPEMDKERLVTQRLINGWLAISLVCFTVWAATQAITYIGSLF